MKRVLMLLVLLLPLPAFAVTVSHYKAPSKAILKNGLFILPVSNGDGYQVNSPDGAENSTWFHDGNNMVFNTSTGVFSFLDSIELGSANYLGWSDAKFYRDASGIASLRNGTNAQEFRVYNMDDGAGNTEYFTASWNQVANQVWLQTVKTGTGSLRVLTLNGTGVNIAASGQAQWSVDTLRLYPVADNSETIGRDAFRPSIVFTYKLSIKDGGAKPTCAVGERGSFWIDEGGAGVKDTVEVCAKDAGDAYAWRTLY